MANRAVIHGAGVDHRGYQEALRLNIARYGERYHDMSSGKYIISAEFLRFVESTYELPLRPNYRFACGLKDSYAAYAKRSSKPPFNLTSDISPLEFEFGDVSAHELRSYFVACRRRWSIEHYTLPFPDTIKFDETPELPWVAKSDGVFLRSVRYPDLVVPTSLREGVYNVIFDDEKGIIAYAISDPRDATGSRVRQ